MTPEELAASIKADILEVKNSLGSFAKEADLQAKFTAIEEQVKKAGENKELGEQLKCLETAMLEQGKVLKELKEKQGEEKHKSIEELLFEKQSHGARLRVELLCDHCGLIDERELCLLAVKVYLTAKEFQVNAIFEKGRV